MPFAKFLKEVTFLGVINLPHADPVTAITSLPSQLPLGGAKVCLGMSSVVPLGRSDYLITELVVNFLHK